MSQCIWCKSTETEYLLERKDCLGDQVFHYLRCRQCGLIRLDPFLSLGEKVRHYPPTYAAYQDQRESWLFRLGRQWYWWRRVHAVHRFLTIRRGAVLDVGCATGGFLAVMQKRGWQVTGIEPNLGAAARARQRLGSEAVQVVHLEEADFPPATFDLITLWDVLDHLQDPPMALRKMNGWLRSRGLLVVGVPYPRSWDARLFGPAWLGWDAPRHLHVFPEDTLQAILDGAGHQVIATCCFYGGYGSLVTSLDYALRERFGESYLGRLLRWVVGLRPCRYLLWPYFRLSEWAGRGPIRTYFCRPMSRTTIGSSLALAGTTSKPAIAGC
jgi:SAM-dependent methyltransferase